MRALSLQESGEMYLETIYILSLKNPSVRAVNICEHMGFSKPSVSRAISLLKKEGYIDETSGLDLKLTDKGLDVAKKMYERHTRLTNALISIGVSPEVAEEDACRIEHVISDETFDCINNIQKN